MALISRLLDRLFDSESRRFHDACHPSDSVKDFSEPPLMREGTYYRLRDGEAIGPLMRYVAPAHPWTTGGHWWRDDGTSTAKNCTHLDIVVEMRSDEEIALAVKDIEARHKEVSRMFERAHGYPFTGGRR